MTQADPGPRRSDPGPQTRSAAKPRRALSDEPPILSGYTYQPGKESTPPPIDPQATHPLLEAQPPTDSIENYQPKKHLGWVIAGVAVIVVAIIVGLILNAIPEQVEPTQTASARPTSYSTDSRKGGIAFADTTTSGYWKITNSVWDGSTVRLNIEITVDSGTLYYDFYAYASNDLTTVDPSAKPGDLRGGFAGPGETVTGVLTFDVPRQPLTLIMISRNQTQLSALPVDG